MPEVLISPLTLFQADATIFDLLLLPEGVERDVVVNTILVETECFSTIYPRPETFKFMVGLWSKKHLWNWEKLYATTQFVYDPIENYNRKESETEKETYSKNINETTDKVSDSTNTETRNLAGTLDDKTNATEGILETRNLQTTNNETRNLKDSVDNFTQENGTTTNSGTDTVTHYVSAFNNPDGISISTEDVTGFGKVVKSQGDTTVTGTTDYTGTDNWQGTDTGTIKQDRDFDETLGRTTSDTGTVDNVGKVTDNEKSTHEDSGESARGREMRAHGNIGVTTTQQMIEQEREVDKFNIYDVILRDFKIEFCVLKY